MTPSGNATTLGGQRVERFTTQRRLNPRRAWSVRLDRDASETWTGAFERMLAVPGAHGVTALAVGAWDEVATGTDSSAVVEALVNARTQLPKLAAVFLGDIETDEAEISWIHQSDVSPLLSAFPRLQELRIRGGTDLSLGRLEHAQLRRLVIESGGLDSSVVRQVAKARLPALEHLELWLGAPNYGATWKLADLKPLFAGKGFPALVHLGLGNSAETDALVRAIVKAPILKQLESLDFSRGTLSDAGAEALLGCPGIAKLKTLDLHHHYVSDEVRSRFARLKRVAIDLSEPATEHRWGGDSSGYRYVSVGE